MNDELIDDNAKNLPFILIILDGWGIADINKGNAIALAKTPVMDELVKKYASTLLHASGKYAGLPVNQVGNSEAGHMNIGGGRVIEQDSVRISRSIIDGTFYKNPAFLGCIRHTKKMKSNVHLIGMLSNGQSPHSDPKHISALLNLLKKHKVEKIFLHLITDGRDSPKYASLKLVDEFENNFFNNEKIVTVIGRFYAMDRKKKWERTERAYNALVLGEGRKSKSAKDAITEEYNRGESDEFIEPYIIEGKKGEDTRIKDSDSVIFFNLRSDRSRQLTKAFTQNNFEIKNQDSFARKKKLQHLYFVTMTDFGPDLDDIITAYPSIDLQKSLPMQLSDLSQLYLAETEKYAHVTYFFNGGYSGKVAGEDQFMINSPDVKSYDETPAMSSSALTDVVIKNLKEEKLVDMKNKKSWKYDFTVLNFAAPDMIGHTGNLKAAIECCHIVDGLVGKICQAYLEKNGTVIITADHGNIEKMINLETDEIFTEHTANPVPFIIVNKKIGKNLKLKRGGSLCDIAPTILKLLNRPKPEEMKGKFLI
jgi:2,3-bisphosphoglycerate-independent phosphoglycerate mutase